MISVYFHEIVIIYIIYTLHKDQDHWNAAMIIKYI